MKPENILNKMLNFSINSIINFYNLYTKHDENLYTNKDYLYTKHNKKLYTNNYYQYYFGKDKKLYKMYEKILEKTSGYYLVQEILELHYSRIRIYSSTINKNFGYSYRRLLFDDILSTINKEEVDRAQTRDLPPLSITEIQDKTTCLFVMQYLILFGQDIGSCSDIENSDVNMDTIVEIILFTYFNRHYSLQSSTNIVEMLHILINDEATDIYGYYYFGYDLINDNNLSNSIRKIIWYKCSKLVVIKNCDVLSEVSNKIEKNKKFHELFTTQHQKFPEKLIFSPGMIEIAHKYISVFLKDAPGIRLNTTDILTIVEMKKYYYDVNYQRYRTTLYKGIDSNITYKNFINFENPSWYGSKKEADIYIKKPVKGNKKPQSIFVYNLYKDTRLLWVNYKQLEIIKKNFGNKPIYPYVIKDWENILHSCKEFNVIPLETSDEDARKILKYGKIIDFAFFNVVKTPPRIVRRSVYYIDVAFTKGLSFFLNSHINNIIGVNDKLSIEGYISEPQINYKNQYFHQEVAFFSSYKILERKSYEGKKCEQWNEKEEDRKWCSTKIIEEKNLYGEKILVCDENVFEKMDKYNNYEAKYLEYWEHIEEWAIEKSIAKGMNKERVQDHIDKWKSFSVNIKSFNNMIQCEGEKKECLDNIDFLVNFTKLFLKRLFYNISQNPYKLIHKKMFRSDRFVWRSNHGSVHHMRSIYLSIKCLKIFKKRNSKAFFRIFKTKSHIVALIIASVFVSLLRIDEDNEKGTGGLKLEFTSKLTFQKIFPVLSKNTTIINYLTHKHPTFSLTQLSSCFMFMTLIKTMLPIDKEFVELLGFSNIFYSTDTLKDLMEWTKEKDELTKFRVVHGLTMFPHYLEHCRGAFSEGIYKNFLFSTLFHIKATQEDQDSLIFCTIKNILKTGEFSHWGKYKADTLRVKHIKECRLNYIKNKCEEHRKSEEFKNCEVLKNKVLKNKVLKNNKEFEKKIKQYCNTEYNIFYKKYCNYSKNFQNCCKNFGGETGPQGSQGSHARFDSEKFFTLSNNFSEIFELLEIEKNLKLLL